MTALTKRQLAGARGGSRRREGNRAQRYNTSCWVKRKTLTKRQSCFDVFLEKVAPIYSYYLVLLLNTNPHHTLSFLPAPPP
mmetsp:Transcript_39877/g.82924  ORF Transcript_39877/g.82924 Transcript_39877/m.82924 type:complete len:81 (-) Transcript_39877:509-751(-)